MSILRFFFVVLFIPNIISQIIPIDFNSIVDQSHQQSHYVSNVDYNLTPQKMLEQISSSLISNQTNRCEQDFKDILDAASKYETWAIKIIDSWGKPLPSGILSGNVYWVGNYDECLQDLYLPSNKSFVSQPFDTQYCESIYLDNRRS